MSANERTEAMFAEQPRQPRMERAKLRAKTNGRKRAASVARRIREERRPVESDPTESEGPAARLTELAEVVTRRVRERPWESFAASLAVGFLVGGALSFRLGRVAMAAAARRVARELLKRVL